MEELIVIKQLPIIEENLKSISEEVQEKVEKAKNIICTEETLKDVKNLRADLNKEFKELEAQRKVVKEQIMKPYDDLDKVYKEYITTVFNEADSVLKNKINSVEDNLKNERIQLAKEYFNNKVSEVNLDTKYLSFEDMNLNITLSISTKKINETIDEKINNVLETIKTISIMKDSEEILVEYIKTKDLNTSIQNVNDRHLILETIKESENNKDISDNQQLEIQEEPVIEQSVEEDYVLEEPEELYTMAFKVWAIGTKQECLEFKKLLDERGYKYEPISE